MLCVRHHRYNIPKGPNSYDNEDEDNSNDNKRDKNGNGGEDSKSPDFIKKVGDKA
jgi:hypothetical protein